MDSKKLVLWGVVAIAASGLGVLVFSPAGGGAGAQDVSPQRAQELVADGIRIIDVRTPGEFEMGHIPGAVNVPMNMLQQESAGWDRGEPLLVYCATGARSADAVRYLADQGFAEVNHFAAGIVAWAGEVTSGSDVAEQPAEPPPAEVPGDAPVLYVFSTDW